MFFNTNTKVYATLAQVSSEQELSSLLSSSVFEISGISGISAQTDSQPYTYQDRANGIGDSVNRGIDTSPGNNLTHSVSLTTYICLTDQLVNNKVLWNALLTGTGVPEFAVKPTYIDQKSDRSQLLPITLLIVNGTRSTVFSGAICSGFSLSAGMTSLLSVNWTFIAFNRFETTLLESVNSALFYNLQQVAVQRDLNLDYVVDKFMLVTVGGYQIPATSFELSINNNVSVVTTNLLGQFNRQAHYKLGARSIVGSISAYVRNGVISDLANQINESYKTNQLTTKLLSVTFKAGTKQANLTLGNAFISPNTDAYNKVYTRTWQYTVNNHDSDLFKLETI